MHRDRGGPAVIGVVVVDDHPVVRDGLAGMFADQPDIVVVGQADDGPQAVAVVRRSDPDVVLMDLRMPGGDGIDAIRELRRTARDRPRILVLTTYDTDRDVRTAMAAGADGFLLKDVRRDDLVRAVRDLRAGRPVLAPSALAALSGRDREPPLSPRETEVLRHVAAGRTNRATASALLVSEATVKTHLLRIYDKLGVGDRAAAVGVAYERGIL